MPNVGEREKIVFTANRHYYSSQADALLPSVVGFQMQSLQLVEVKSMEFGLTLLRTLTRSNAGFLHRLEKECLSVTEFQESGLICCCRRVSLSSDDRAVPHSLSRGRRCNRQVSLSLSSGVSEARRCLRRAKFLATRHSRASTVF